VQVICKNSMLPALSSSLHLSDRKREEATARGPAAYCKRKVQQSLEK